LNELNTINLPYKKALLAVTSDGMMKTLGYQYKVTQMLNKSNIDCVIYDKVQANPTGTGVAEAAALARSEGCDFTIGLGGGSSIDTAKAVALVINNSGSIWDYTQPEILEKLTKNDVLPIIAIATTAGTGTETDPWSVITNTETKEKISFKSELIFPTISIIDPELMVSLPARLTAFQGMDAFFHALEGYIAKCASPLSDLFALKAIELVVKNLPEAVRNGANIEARTNISYAANVLAGFVQSISACTSPHKIGETLGGMFPKLPHGASLIVFAEKYYEKVADKLPDRLTEISKAMGIKVEGRNKIDVSMAFFDALHNLLSNCGVENIKMSDYGIKKEDLSIVAGIAAKNGYPRDRYCLTTLDTLEILEESYS
jgi:alcohol dehydrogenase